MKLQIRTLMIDGSVVTSSQSSKCRRLTNAMVDIGTRLRKENSAVAACRTHVDRYTWVGNYNDDQGKAIAKADSIDW